MPKEWYLMGANTYFSGGEIENFDDYAREGFNELLYASPETENVLINNVQKRVIIQNTMTENLKLITIRHMLSHIGDSKEGCYVDFRGNKWLVLAIPENNKMYEKSIIQLCNHNLKWIDKNDNLVIRPSIISAKTLYTTGVKEGKQVVVPDGMVGIQIPYDEDTSRLARNDKFIFNNTKYKITFYNKAEFPGLLVLICDEELPDERVDDLENEIAGRYRSDGSDRLSRPPSEPEIPEEPKGDYTIKLECGYDSLVFGLPIDFTAKVYLDGEEVDKIVKFELVENQHLAWIEVDESNPNMCNIYGNKERDSGTVTLRVYLIDDKNVYIEKELNVGAW